MSSISRVSDDRTIDNVGRDHLNTKPISQRAESNNIDTIDSTNNEEGGVISLLLSPLWFVVELFSSMINWIGSWFSSSSEQTPNSAEDTVSQETTNEDRIRELISQYNDTDDVDTAVSVLIKIADIDPSQLDQLQLDEELSDIVDEHKDNLEELKKNLRDYVNEVATSEEEEEEEVESSDDEIIHNLPMSKKESPVTPLNLNGTNSKPKSNQPLNIERLKTTKKADSFAVSNKPVDLAEALKETFNIAMKKEGVTIGTLINSLSACVFSVSKDVNDNFSRLKNLAELNDAIDILVSNPNEVKTCREGFEALESQLRECCNDSSSKKAVSSVFDDLWKTVLPGEKRSKKSKLDKVMNKFRSPKPNEKKEASQNKTDNKKETNVPVLASSPSFDTKKVTKTVSSGTSVEKKGTPKGHRRSRSLSKAAKKILGKKDEQAPELKELIGKLTELKELAKKASPAKTDGKDSAEKKVSEVIRYLQKVKVTEENKAFFKKLTKETEEALKFNPSEGCIETELISLGEEFEKMGMSEVLGLLSDTGKLLKGAFQELESSGLADDTLNLVHSLLSK